MVHAYSAIMRQRSLSSALVSYASRLQGLDGHDSRYRSKGTASISRPHFRAMMTSSIEAMHRYTLDHFKAVHLARRLLNHCCPSTFFITDFARDLFKKIRPTTMQPEVDPWLDRRLRSDMGHQQWSANHVDVFVLPLQNYEKRDLFSGT